MCAMVNYGVVAGVSVVARADQAEDRSRALRASALSAHLVSGDGREDALVRPGYELSVTIFNISTVVYTQLIIKSKIVMAIRYAMTNWCNVRLKAGIGQLNLPNETNY